MLFGKLLKINTFSKFSNKIAKSDCNFDGTEQETAAVVKVSMI